MSSREGTSRARFYCLIQGIGDSSRSYIEAKTWPASTCWMAGSRSLATRGFTIYPKAPHARQLRTNSASECTVRKITFDSQPSFLSSSTASIPFKTGMEIYVSIRSGLCRSAASTSDHFSEMLATLLPARFEIIGNVGDGRGWSSARSTRTVSSIMEKFARNDSRRKLSTLPEWSEARWDREARAWSTPGSFDQAPQPYCKN